MPAAGTARSDNANSQNPFGRDMLRPLAYLLVIFAIFYASQLFGFPFSIDAEFAAVRTIHDVWVAQGRWTVYIVQNLLIPQTTIPFLPYAYFGLGVSIGYLLFLRALGVARPNFGHYAAFPLFVAFPTWFFLTAFSANTAALGFGMSFAGAAACMFAQRIARADRGAARGWNPRARGLFALEILAGAAAVGVYQSFLVTMIAMLIGVLLAEELRGSSTATTIGRRILSLIVVVVLTIAAYSAISYLFRIALGAQTTYLDGYIDLASLARDPNGVLTGAMRELFRVYAGHIDVYGARAFAFGFLPLFGLLAIVLTPALRRRLWLWLIAAFALLVLPFLLNVVSGGFMPYRTMVAVPVVMTLFALFALGSPYRWLVRATYVALVLTAAQILFVFNQFQAAEAFVRARDLTLAAAIYTRIVDANPNYDRTRIYKVDFYGEISFTTVYPLINSSTIGASFFEWDGGNPYRVSDYMGLVGYGNLRAIGDEERRKLLPQFQSMEVWPKTGSVRVVDGVTLIKLGDKPGAVHQNAKSQQ